MDLGKKDAGQIDTVYFIGIGGIGMSALARYFHFHGKKVSGYDRQETTLTRQLEAEGIAVHYDDNPERVPTVVDVVVYTPAIPADHKELNFCRAQGYRMMKRSEVLGWITSQSYNVCVAGTHGKTTISTLVAHLLRHSGYGCNAFLGGIAVNYNSNYWSHERNVCVVEADEYDRSFLKLFPDIAVVSAMDADHLDIYGTPAALEEAFIAFTRQLKPGGLLVRKFGLPRGGELASSRVLTYSLDQPQADGYAVNIVPEAGGYRFDVQLPNLLLKEVRLMMGGLHNIENCVAAISVAHFLGIDGVSIRNAIADFRGVRRRFEYAIRPGEHPDGVVLIDDYAHHPEELRTLIVSARKLFAGKKCVVIFQPHLYSRTRDFADGFAAVLDLADEVVLLPVYPARELPIEGVSSELLLGKMEHAHKQLLDKAALLDWVSATPHPQQVILMAGAGDIDALVGPVKERLCQH